MKTEASLLKFRRPSVADYEIAYKQYLELDPLPFFVDICGPEPHLTREDFLDYCTDDSALWVAIQADQLLGFLLFYDIQPGIHLASLDLWLAPDVSLNPDTQARLLAALQKASRSLRIRKTVLGCLASDKSKQTWLTAIGFQPAGTLLKHLFHQGQLHDLSVFSREEQ